MWTRIKSVLYTYRMSISMGALIGAVHIAWMELQLSEVFKRSVFILLSMNIHDDYSNHQ